MVLVGLPGEIYPELLLGGVEHCDDPTRVWPHPPLYDLLADRLPFVIGLANDCLGYVVPPSQWPADGAVTSPGIDLAPALFAALLPLLPGSPSPVSPLVAPSP